MNLNPNTTSTYAILSLAFGIMAWIMAPLLGAIVAVVCGHLARAEIRRSPHPLEGDGMALAGLVLGYLQIALALVLALIMAIFFGGLVAVIASAAMQA
ncbi:MAG TPA: DUF4190 domain-containing protein [Pseudomonadota bacterium]|mgnify:CR=1 FL=1|jgi:hypothetical protein|nr:DUF4190 domain-containing protein [Pseudomonadota bacterium]